MPPLGNFIGVSVVGLANQIGGTAPGSGNLISGNLRDGVFIGDGGQGTRVQGNSIGTDLTGTLTLRNGGNGVVVSGGSARDNTIGGTMPGAGNTIAFNGGDGILIDAGTSNAIRGNSIFGNGGLGIDLLRNGNNNQPAPVLTSASSSGGFLTFQGVFAGRPSTTCTLEFYANTTADPSGFGQGERFLGSITVTTDVSGRATFALSLAIDVPPGEFLSATATDPNNNTSAFSRDVLVTG